MLYSRSTNHLSAKLQARLWWLHIVSTAKSGLQFPNPVRNTAVQICIVAFRSNPVEIVKQTNSLYGSAVNHILSHIPTKVQKLHRIFCLISWTSDSSRIPETILRPLDTGDFDEILYTLLRILKHKIFSSTDISKFNSRMAYATNSKTSLAKHRPTHHRLFCSSQLVKKKHNGGPQIAN